MEKIFWGVVALIGVSVSVFIWSAAGDIRDRSELFEERQHASELNIEFLQMARNFDLEKYAKRCMEDDVWVRSLDIRTDVLKYGDGYETDVTAIVEFDPFTAEMPTQEHERGFMALWDMQNNRRPSRVEIKIGSRVIVTGFSGAFPLDFKTRRERALQFLYGNSILDEVGDGNMYHTNPGEGIHVTD